MNTPQTPHDEIFSSTPIIAPTTKPMAPGQPTPRRPTWPTTLTRQSSGTLDTHHSPPTIAPNKRHHLLKPAHSLRRRTYTGP
jgi:hypothetical protein